MRQARMLFLSLAIVGCDVGLLDLPPPPPTPGPGTITGVVVAARPGRAQRDPAPGTSVTLLGTSLSTTTDADGRFVLEGIVDAQGSLLFRFQPATEGAEIRQRLVKLTSIGAGPNRQVALGEVAVTENARIAGRVRKSDLASQAGGHGGIRVFVPEAPYATLTADDGSFLLEGLPEGPAVVAFFADGYRPLSIDGIELSGGQELVLADRGLEKLGLVETMGSIRGRVQLDPPAAQGQLVVVNAVPSSGEVLAATAAPEADGSASFVLPRVPPGIYTVLVSQPGYESAEARNVPVFPGEASDLSTTVVLVAAASAPACTGGDACVPDDACHLGRTRCVGGVANCERLPDLVPAGAGCGVGRVCGVDGACRSCNPGASCVPDDACHEGLLSCATGVPTCEDTGAFLSAGSSCGEAAVCSDTGACVSCLGGQACDAGECRVGAISCDSGTPECRSLGLFQPAGRSCGDDRVCSPDGACVECVAETACSPLNRCREGRRSCDRGTPRCVETDTFVGAGTSCAEGRVCDGAGSCVPCLEGASCSPEDPCHAGEIRCTTGAPTCVDLGTPGPAGTPCAPGSVCTTTGGCEPCALGTLCQAAPCRLGSIACDSGSPVCRENGLLMLSGESCGDGAVCDPSGACQACEEGGSCVPSNPCRAGTVSCSTGVPRCVESGDVTTAGTSCGAGRVCDGLGGCVACSAGVDCVPSDAPCERGEVSCASGAPVCVASGVARTAGFTCQAGRVCSPAGTCDACVPDEVCQPANEPCRTGRIECSSGTPSCQPTNLFASAGTGCGPDLVCSPAGACVACDSGATCLPANPCRRGVLSCLSGVPTCEDAGAAQPTGSTCGTGRVCNAAAQCIACEQGASCSPTNPCLTGTLDCASGAPTCNATGTPIANGTTCGTRKVCGGGLCNDCDAGAACVPANPCHRGTTACGSGMPACTDVGTNQPDGTNCGTARICKAGFCLASGLSVASGDAQVAAPGQTLALPVVLELRDASGALLPNKTVTLALPAGSWTSATTFTTSAIGRVSFNWRLGYTVGPHVLTATCASESATAAVSATVERPVPGTITTIGNVPRGSSIDKTNAVASQASLSRPVSLARGSDGTLFVLDQGGVVRRMNPDGTSEYLGGGGTAGWPAYGDGGAASAADLQGPRGLAYDEARGQVYFSSQGTQRTRFIDLATRTIGAFAGTGDYNNPAGPGFGDGGPATFASLWVPGGLWMTGDGKVLVADTQHHLLRRIDPDSGRIESVLGITSCSGTPPGNVWLNNIGNFDPRAGMVAQAGDDLYLVGNFCFANGATFLGIGRRDTAGRWWHVVGNPAYQAPVDGVAGSLVSLAGYASLAVDAGGNLYFGDMGSANANGHRLRRVDAGSGRVRLLGGDGTAGFAGDGGPLSGARFNEPSDLLFDPAGNLFIADASNRAIRRVERLGRSDTDTVVLTSLGGEGQSAGITRQAAQALSVRVTDSTGGTFPGATVRFRAVDPGGAVYTPSAIADATGRATTMVRAGLATGTYRFEATVLDLLNRPPPAGPLTWSLTATPISAGTLTGVVNVARNAGFQRVGSAATIAVTGYLTSVSFDADGNFYVSDAEQDAVYRVSATGQLTILAGTPGTGGFSGDGGPATNARLQDPSDAVVSADGATVFIADSANDRIRAVDLASGIITTYAGGGTQTSYPFGDGGPASSAVVTNPTQLTIGPLDGALYFRDRNNSANSVRRIDAVTRFVSEFWRTTSTPCASGAVVVSNCSYVTTEGSCNLAFDAQGNAYLTTLICGSSVGSTSAETWGVLKRTPGGAVSWWAGFATGAVSTPAVPKSSLFEAAPFVSFDAAGNAYFVERDRHRIRRYDATTGLVSPLVGNGVAGFGVEEGPLSSVQLNQPRRVAFDRAGRAFIPDATNRTVRAIW